MIDRLLPSTLICLALGLAIVSVRVQAAEFLSGVEVYIGPDQVLAEDVYAFAGQIVIEGTINGDLVAAGDSIEIKGSINGDLIAAARSISVSGPVTDDIRAAGTNLLFTGSVGGDLIAAADHMEINAIIDEDLVADANNLFFTGEVRGNVDLGARQATVSGTVQGDVRATVAEQFILEPESRIQGSLSYTALNDLTMHTGAEVVGGVSRRMPMISIFGNEYQASTLVQVLGKIISQTQWFIGTLLTGILLIWLFPETMRQVVALLSSSPWKSLGMGALTLPLTPIILMILMIVTLSIIGSAAFPVVAVPAMTFAALLLLAKPAIAIALGQLFRARFDRNENYSPRAALLVGAAALAVVGLVPFVDSMVAWLSVFIGLGAWLLFLYRRYRAASKSNSV